MTDAARTKKIRRRRNNTELWGKFTEAVGPLKQIECLFDKNREGTICTCCGAILVTMEEGFPACPSPTCGVIYKEMIDQGAEWRYYGADDGHGSDPTRAGPPTNPLLPVSSIGCRVILSGRATYEMRKIRRYTEWQSMPYKEKSQYEEFQRISALATAAGIPKLIVDDAMRYHKRISEYQTFRGVNRDGIIAASIYIAARINAFPRTAREIAAIFNLDNASATRGCKNAMTIINELERDMGESERTTLCPTTPLAFIARYCSRLEMTRELTDLCQFIAIRIQLNNMVPENTPHSIAAGIVFFVSQSCGLGTGKKAVHGVSEISEVTINKCFRKLEAIREHLLPTVILEKYALGEQT
jgi:transcription initiation factor TFIIB